MATTALVTALVTGSADRVGEVVDALSAAGAEAVGVTDLDRLAAEVKRYPPGSLDCYIQLPVVLRPSGSTVTARVRDFLDQGLITRFRLAETVLTALSPDARVVLVGGHAPMERTAPDDTAARLAFLDVLAHAIRADKAPAKVRVRVLADGPDPRELARLALTGERVSRRAAGRGRLPVPAVGTTYEDWRTEVLGLVSAEF